MVRVDPVAARSVVVPAVVPAVVVVQVRRSAVVPAAIAVLGPAVVASAGGPRPEVEVRTRQIAREPRAPRLGPDGQPLPPRSKRPRKPIGPDASGNGPDGKPWDPERRAQRQAERAAQGRGSGESMRRSDVGE